MRFIHTADWHLGRILFGVHLTDDQAYILDQFHDILKENQPDLLVIAGDIYDRAVPPPEAVRLLDDFLVRTVNGLSIPVLVMAGNHDSPDRIGFASKLLEDKGLFMRGSVFSDSFVTQIHDKHGPVNVYALPYAEPPLVREKTGDNTVKDHDSAMKALVEGIRPSLKEGTRNIIVAHAFVAGGSESESERPLAVGGSASVDPAVFHGFNYVALGHLHRPQTAGAPHIRYSGSLLPYSFSEAGHAKSVTLIDMGPDGTCDISSIPLEPQRNLRIVTGFMDDILKNPESDDYIQVNLLDTAPVLDAIGKLKIIYPNLLHIERPHLGGSDRPDRFGGDHRKIGHQDLFASFFREVTGETLTPAMEECYSRIVNDQLQKEREAL